MPHRYEVLSHTADTGVLVRGATVTELFENAAFALFDLMFGIADREGAERVEVEVAATTIEQLLVDWLSDLLFEAETRDLAFCRFEIEKIGDGRVKGRASGIPSAELELVGPPIKAVTYHGLAIEELPDGLSARVVFDV
jgi:SHS2 domain-containing protein